MVIPMTSVAPVNADVRDPGRSPGYRVVVVIDFPNAIAKFLQLGAARLMPAGRTTA